MIWLFLLRATYHAWSGWRWFDLLFRCEPCGAELPARVASDGRATVRGGIFGRAPDRERAHELAERAACSNAQRSLAWAPCPRCHAFPPRALAATDRVARFEARKASLRAPLSFAAGAVVLLAFAFAAVLLHRPLLMLPAAGATAAAWACGTLLLAPSSPSMRLVAPANVWFWTRARGSGAEPRWVSAAEATPDAAPEGAPHARPLPYAPGARLRGFTTTMLVGGLMTTAGGAGVYWIRTSHVHVANPGRGDLTIRIDGAVAGVVHAEAEGGDDIGADSFALSKESHVLEAVDARGAVVERATIDARQGDFLFAPGAPDSGACFAVEDLVYAKSWTQPIAEGPALHLLPRDGVVWRLPAPTNMTNWRRPLPSLQLSKGESTKRVNLLRAFACPGKGDPTPESRPFAHR